MRITESPGSLGRSEGSPRPWRADAPGTVIGADGAIVARVGPGAAPVGAPDPARLASDTRLIASAPALLAACEGALAQLERGVRDALRVLGEPTAVAAAIESPVLAQLRAAIAIARGGEGPIR